MNRGSGIKLYSWSYQFLYSFSQYRKKKTKFKKILEGLLWWSSLVLHLSMQHVLPGWGAKTSHALWPKKQNIEQKQNCSKFNKDFKNGPHPLKKKIFKKVLDKTVKKIIHFIKCQSLRVCVFNILHEETPSYHVCLVKKLWFHSELRGPLLSWYTIFTWKNNHRPTIIQTWVFWKIFYFFEK